MVVRLNYATMEETLKLYCKLDLEVAGEKACYENLLAAAPRIGICPITILSSHAMERLRRS